MAAASAASAGGDDDSAWRGREVVTLQFGTFANFVGAHVWNIEDEQRATPDGGELLPRACVRFTAGAGPKDAPVATPRLVAYDLHGAMGAVPQLGTLHPDLRAPAVAAAAEQEGLAWQGRVDVRAATAVPKNAFQRSLEGAEQ